MSTAVVSTSAALGRPFLFDTEPDVRCHPVSNDVSPCQAFLSNTSPLAPVVSKKRHFALSEKGLRC